MNIARLKAALQEAKLVITQLRNLLAGIHAQAEAAEAAKDPFVILIFTARTRYQQAIDADTKSRRPIERVIHDTFHQAKAHGYAGQPDDWLKILQPGIVYRPQKLPLSTYFGDSAPTAPAPPRHSAPPSPSSS